MCPAVCADGHHPNGHRGRGPVRSRASGGLTAIVPFDLVDAVLSETRTVQRRLRDLPSRVGSTFCS
ncbi:transposase domain-containing protein [Streptomyces sp. NPDC055134]